MGDIAQRGNRLTAAKGGRIGKFGGGRTNLLEELGRVEAEPSNRNRRAEISRVHGELNRGYAKGGRAGLRHGNLARGLKKVASAWQARKEKKRLSAEERELRPTGLGAAKGGRAGYFAGSLVKNIPKLLKKLGKEIKAQPLPPQLQKTLDEVKKLQKLQKPGVKKAKGGRAGFKTGKIAGPKQQRLSRRVRLEKKKESIKDLIVKQKEEKKDYKPKSYLEKDTEKQAKTSELMKYGMPKKYKPFPQHMDWKTGPVKSEAYKKRVSDVADIHIAHGGEGFKKGGKTDKKWIQKAVNPKHKGYCTPMTKKTCTPARKALARTFKKKAKTGWG